MRNIHHPLGVLRFLGLTVRVCPVTHFSAARLTASSCCCDSSFAASSLSALMAASDADAPFSTNSASRLALSQSCFCAYGVSFGSALPVCVLLLLSTRQAGGVHLRLLPNRARVDGMAKVCSLSKLRAGISILTTVMFLVCPPEP